MRKKFFLLIGLLAAVILAGGLAVFIHTGYGKEVWKDVLEGRSYMETAEYEQKASEAVRDALAVMAESTRLERNGAYDPDRIIRVNDYLESGIIYDTVPESEKKNGICYRLGDLYQWSLQGASVNYDILNEAYPPLFYGSVQSYVNDNDEFYNVVVKQITAAMEKLKNEVTAYQENEQAWNPEVTNVRYALRSLSDESVYTNVAELKGPDLTAEQCEAYFKGLGSYYLFDSRSDQVVQAGMGDCSASDVRELLAEHRMDLKGEYQVYVGIDTSFPAADALAAGALAYGEAEEEILGLSFLVIPMILSGAVLLFMIAWILVRLCRLLWKALRILFGNAGTAVRVCVYFVGYELIQALLHLLFGETALGTFFMLLFKGAVLALLVWEGIQRQKVLEEVRAMAAGHGEGRISTRHLFYGSRQLAEAVNDLGEGLRNALQEQMKSERMKADLITNVSHDLKTPLTSIINYVDLMKRERIENPKAQEYLKILDQKSQRLKQLTEDLVEASRASSGNVTLNMEKIDLKEMLMQTSGEFEERFAARGLSLVSHYPEYPLYVEADGRRLWRVIENLYRNVEKYAMPQTRVYLEVEQKGSMASMSMKNISEQPLNITAEELMERFVRGDESRSTEGSGLGLSIARDLTELQHGTFDIYLDGDLFKVIVAFPIVKKEEAI